MQLSDERLLALFLIGDEDAFAALTRRYQRRFIEAMDRRLGDRQAAEDVVQAAWIKVVNHADSYDPTKLTFEQWAWLICVNCSVDEYRRKQRDRHLTNAGDSLGQYRYLVDGRTNALDPPDLKTDDPVTYAHHREFSLTFWTFFNGLSEKYQQAVRLIFIDGHSYNQAAAISGVLAITLKKRVARVKGDLQRVLRHCQATSLRCLQPAQVA